TAVERFDNPGEARDSQAVSATHPTTRRKSKRTVERFLLGIALPVALDLGWEVVVRAGWAEGRLMPPPSRILQTLYSLAVTGELWLHIGATLARVGAGFA